MPSALSINLRPDRTAVVSLKGSTAIYTVRRMPMRKRTCLYILRFKEPLMLLASNRRQPFPVRLEVTKTFAMRGKATARK